MNEKLKLVRNLLEKRSARRKERLFVVEGPHLVEEAIGKIKFVVYVENSLLVSRLVDQRIQCLKVSKNDFAQLTNVEVPQGILAVVKEDLCPLSDLILGDKTLIVYCCGLQDPGNLGTIIRSAAALGASGLILSKGTVDLYNPKVIRASMGALFYLPIHVSADDQKTLGQLKEINAKIIATSQQKGKRLEQVDLAKPIVFLVGNEGSGVPAELAQLADENITIPMAGRAESLNVGSATAIMLYEVARQRAKE